MTKAIEVLQERLKQVNVDHSSLGACVGFYGPLEAVDVERLAFVALEAIGVPWDAEIDEVVVLR